MAIRIRRGLESDRLSVTPDAGEFLYTTDNKEVYIGDGVTAGGTLVGGAGSLFITSILDTANIDLDVTSSTLSADLTNTTVIPNTYGDANNIPQITVDQKGRVTSVTDIPITIPPNYIDSISDTSTIDLTVTGTTLSADFASMNISQFTNDSGYITSSSIPDIISPFLLMGA